MTSRGQDALDYRNLGFQCGNVEAQRASESERIPGATHEDFMAAAIALHWDWARPPLENPNEDLFAACQDFAGGFREGYAAPPQHYERRYPDA